jgi:very-short-patch-repair endonuclease
VAVGLTPFTQYRLAGCRLDLAFRDARLDVEVDGERFHRDAQGRRKAEDLWRDLAIRAAGWTVLRFWVYELREDMAACARKVQDRLTSLPENTSVLWEPSNGAAHGFHLVSIASCVTIATSPSKDAARR